jgi:hypothetical protein
MNNRIALLYAYNFRKISYFYSLGENQINALRKLRAYVQNTHLVGKDQGLIRRQCLEYWQVCYLYCTYRKRCRC